MSASAAGPATRATTGVALSLILVGAALRVAHFLEGRGLWSDEVRLAVNLMERSFLGLLHPLDYDQVAPIPFLWLTRATLLLTGPSPLGLRLWPLLGGLGLLVAMWALARRLMPAGPALLALGLVALSPITIYYAAELKPYGIDALVAVLLIWVATRLLEAPGDPARWRALIASGAISVGCSSSAILVLAGIGLGLLASPEIHRTVTGWRRLVMTGTLWLLAFLPWYLLVYRPGSSSEMMQAGWVRHFLTPGSPDLRFRADFLAQTIVGRFFFLSSIGPSRLSAMNARWICLAVAAGFAFLIRRRGPALALCVAGPILLTLLGSAARLYPLWPRLVLFVLPSMALLLAEAIWGILGLGLHRRPLLLAGSIASLALLYPSARTAAIIALHPIHRDESGLLVRRFFEESQPTDPVFVAAGAAPAWAFHSTDWSRPDSARLRWLAQLGTSGGASFLNHPSRGHAVQHEGWELRRPLDQRTELMGIFTGVTTTYMPPWPKASIDSGWADNEADRMLAEGSTRLWLFSSELNSKQIGALREALARRGAREETRYEEIGASMSLFKLDHPRRIPASTTGPRP